MAVCRPATMTCGARRTAKDGWNHAERGKEDYLKLLVEDIHSAMMATIGADGHPQTRVIDMMLYDEQCVYFLTAKGKAFYAQLMEQG